MNFTLFTLFLRCKKNLQILASYDNIIFVRAGMSELADEADSKSVDGNIVWVQVPLPAVCIIAEPLDLSVLQILQGVLFYLFWRLSCGKKSATNTLRLLSFLFLKHRHPENPHKQRNDHNKPDKRFCNDHTGISPKRYQRHGNHNFSDHLKRTGN